MIIQAAARYYKILAADPNCDIPRRGYSIVNINFVLVLSRDGEIVNLIPLVEKVMQGKKEVERAIQIVVPEQVQRSGSSPKSNFLWDNSTFVLGITSNEAPGYGKLRFDSFRERNRGALAGIDCPEAQAVIAFFDRYDMESIRQNESIADQIESLLKGMNSNIIFKLDGKTEYIHESERIKKFWDNSLKSADSETIGQCLATGAKHPIARLHRPLKGVYGARPTGAVLVGVNDPAYESFNKKQGEISPVSAQVEFEYTTALNYLLTSNTNRQRINLAETTVIYWAESPDKSYTDLFRALFTPEWTPSEEEMAKIDSTRDPTAEKALKAITEAIREGKPIDLNSTLEGIDPDTKFYILGIKPNAARASVKFFLQEPFITVVKNVMQHYQDMQIEKQFPSQFDLLYPFAIVNETISPNAQKKEASPLLAGTLLQAILTKRRYPEMLYTSIITRIRCDADNSDKRIEKINYIRASIIKGCLTRKTIIKNNKQIQEVLTMTLNTDADMPAYVLGRLFAVLEKAQIDAAFPNKLNSTIKDRYFASACATPATVFPVLLRLAQHHISKAEYGRNIDLRIQDIMQKLDVERNPFPAHLSLDDQGIFILGYYHQRNALYKSLSSKIDDSSPETEKQNEENENE